MAASAISGYSSTLMFKQQPAFWAGVVEDVPFLQRLKGMDNGVRSDGHKYYVKETAFTAIPYSMRTVSTEGGAMPSAGDVTDVLPYWSLKEHALKKTFSTRALNEGDLIGAIDIESANMKAAQWEIAHFTKHELMGDSTAFLTRIVPTGANTFTADNPYALRVGMTIDGMTAITSGSATIDSKTITAFDKTTEVFTAASHGGTTGTGYFAKYEDDSDDWGENLGALLSTTAGYYKGDVVILPPAATYAALTRASTANWDAYAMEASGTFSAKYWAKFMAKLVQAQNVGQSKVNAAYAAPESIAALLESIPEEERLLGDPVGYGTTRPVQLKSQFLAGGTLDLVPVNGFHPYCIAFLNESDLGVRWPKEPGWDMSGGSILQSNVKEYSGYAQYTAAWLQVLGLIGHPIEHGLLYGFDYLA